MIKSKQFNFTEEPDMSEDKYPNGAYWFAFYNGDTPGTGTGKPFGFMSHEELKELRNRINIVLGEL